MRKNESPLSNQELNNLLTGDNMHIKVDEIMGMQQFKMPYNQRKSGTNRQIIEYAEEISFAKKMSGSQSPKSIGRNNAMHKTQNSSVNKSLREQFDTSPIQKPVKQYNVEDFLNKTAQNRPKPTDSSLGH